jgi:hypothetical protein
MASAPSAVGGSIRSFAAAVLAAVGLAATSPAASPPPAGQINLQAPEYQAIREAYERKKAELNAPRLDKLRSLLKKQIADADATLKEKELAGNIKGMAIARTAKTIFEECRDDLEKKQDFTFPARVRRELEPTLATCREEKQKLDEAFTNQLAGIEEESFLRFTEVVRNNPQTAAMASDRESLKGWFRELLRTEKPAPKPPTTGPATNAAPTNVVAGATNVVAAKPAIFARSGDAEKWVLFGRWTADMVAMDIVALPVLGRAVSGETQKYNPMTGQNSTLRYEAIRALPLRGDYRFRLRSMPGMEPVDVLDWPSEANGFTLAVRTHADILSHGFEMEAGLPAVEITRLFPDTVEPGAEAPTNAPLPKVKLNIATKPPDALVYVDGVLYRNDKEAPVTTPCTITVDAGYHTIRVSLLTYLEMMISNYNFREDRDVWWTFRKDPRVVEKTLIVSARNDGWTSSGIKIDKSYQVLIEAEGKWVCGNKGEECGPDGYPNTKDFFHYYVGGSGPRQLLGSNYGALLVKLNENGSPRLIGKGGTIVTDKAGTLFFDINETPYKVLRRDNSGALTLKLTVIPPR